MPWTETRVVDQRTEFVLRVLSNRERFGNLCREFGVSRKTGYKWKERFFEDGLAPLARIPPRRQNGPNLRLLPHPQPAQRVTRQPVHDEAGGSRVRCGLRCNQSMSSATLKGVTDFARQDVILRRAIPESSR